MLENDYNSKFYVIFIIPKFFLKNAKYTSSLYYSYFLCHRVSLTQIPTHLIPFHQSVFAQYHILNEANLDHTI